LLEGVVSVCGVSERRGTQLKGLRWGHTCPALYLGL
jgi:hypothetical protein